MQKAKCSKFYIKGQSLLALSGPVSARCDGKSTYNAGLNTPTKTVKCHLSPPTLARLAERAVRQSGWQISYI